MPFFEAYGMKVDSALPLPVPVTTAGAADVTVRPGRVDPETLQADAEGRFFRATAAEACVFREGVGAIRVRAGREIVVDSAPPGEAETVCGLLLGPAFACLLHQRGHLVLHASAVAMNGTAVAFLGESGKGKSTLAAALVSRGHRLLTDDILAVSSHDRVAAVIPGVPLMKLWPEAESVFDDGHCTPTPEKSCKGKRIWKTGRNFPRKALPLGCINILEEGKGPKFESIDSGQALLELIRHSYTARLLMGTGTAASHFQQVAKVAGDAKCRRLIRGQDLRRIDNLARMVEEDATRKG